MARPKKKKVVFVAPTKVELAKQEHFRALVVLKELEVVQRQKR